MKNVKFDSEIIKSLYQEIVNKHRALAPIVLQLCDECQGILFRNISMTDKGYELWAIKGYDNTDLCIDIDLLKKKIYVNRCYPNSSIDVYDNIPKMYNNPIAHQYEKDSRILYETLTFKLSKDDSVKYLELRELNEKYTIIIDGVNEDNFDMEKFIDVILNNPKKYKSIRNLFKQIKNNIITLYVDIKLADSKGSTIIINKGIITKYLEYIEKDDEFIKVYMEDGNFYSERKVKEEYNDKIVTYVNHTNRMIKILRNKKEK